MLCNCTTFVPQIINKNIKHRIWHDWLHSQSCFFIVKQLNHKPTYESNTFYEPRRVGSLRARRDAY